MALSNRTATISNDEMSQHADSDYHSDGTDQGNPGGRNDHADRSGHAGHGGNRDHDAQRHALIWEAVLGFVSFFTAISGIQAVWNVFRPDPAVGPAVLFAVLLAVFILVWRRYRRMFGRQHPTTRAGK